ncbi:hypothetical protein ETB97_011511 [Aspergillus alliaceus]|uniref:NB-ARC domain-containing protein n=1 Tax=Petromyces alliaceus TaxID=209559 RepID=A0A8H6E989_PETAA|nr:hypothetical protein ETB97_011511 [Aspergillus burnettii]
MRTAIKANHGKHMLQQLEPPRQKLSWSTGGLGTKETRHIMIPFGRIPRFVGRQDEIHKLKELILTPEGPKELAITGLGGDGKTQIALELAYRKRDSEAECSIFWVPCTSYEAVEQACMAVAQMVGIQDVKPAEVKDCLRAYFSQKEGKWLLIFDNADDMDMWTKDSSISSVIEDFLPYNDQGHVVFTTRNRELAENLISSYIIHVRELDAKTGMKFLKRSQFIKICAMIPMQ